MNAYLIQEDGDYRVWLADTMAAALEQHLADYRIERENDGEEWNDEQLTFYQDSIVQSCQYLGPVAEVRPTNEEIDLRTAMIEIDNCE